LVEDTTITYNFNTV